MWGRQPRWLIRISFCVYRAPPVSIDQIISDFDNVSYHISTPESKSKILISISVKCFKELVQYGAQEVLEREYGPYIVAPESGYDFSVQVDLDNLPGDQGEDTLWPFCVGYWALLADKRRLQRLRTSSFAVSPC